MKTIPVAITAITLALTGCAHSGYYQQGYTGYGGGYTVDSYYGSPVQGYYYQSGGSYSYDRYYSPSYPSHHRDYDRDQRGDRDRHENWLHEGPRHNHQQSNFQQNDQRRWTSEMPHQQQENFDRATEHAQRQQIESRGQRQYGDQPDQQHHSRQFSDSAPAEHRRHGGDGSNGGGR